MGTEKRHDALSPLPPQSGGRSGWGHAQVAARSLQFRFAHTPIPALPRFAGEGDNCVETH